MVALASELADRVSTVDYRALPDSVRREAGRGLANIVAVTMAGLMQEASEIAVQASVDMAEFGEVPILGKDVQLSEGAAAMVIGVAAHVDDYDDTHLETVIHPSAVPFAALVPLLWSSGSIGATASGNDFLRAYLLGCEVELRLGRAMSPSHYDRGWHITGTCGVVGAAVSAACFLHLSREQTARAIALATGMTVGQRESFGTMAKSWHVGQAAKNGLTAARAAAAGTAVAGDVLDRRGGYLDMLSGRIDQEAVLNEFGDDWLFGEDTYKPYPCGIVAHPLIDAGLVLHGKSIDWAGVDVLDVRCNPLVPELMGARSPSTPLEARFSAVHDMASAVVDGYFDLRSLTEGAISRGSVARIRDKIRLLDDPDVARDAAEVSVRLDGGELVEAAVQHARGSAARPLTTEELHNKVDMAAERNPDAPSGQEVWETVMSLEVSDLRSLRKILHKGVMA